MPYLSILIVSFIATLSLASPVAREKPCSLNSSGNGNEFRLLSVSKKDRDIQMPLAIGSNSDPQPNSDIWLGVSTLFFQSPRFARELMSQIWNVGYRDS